MADPLPTQPVAPGAPPSPAPQPGIFEAFKAVLTRPADFYASVRDVGGFGGPLVFAIVMGLASGLISACYALFGLGGVAGATGAAIGAFAGFSAIILSPIFAVIGCFVGGAIVHVISLIAGGKGTYEQSVRVAGYAAAVMPISALVTFVPILRVLPGLYGLYLVAMGLLAIHAADRRKTFVSVGVLAAILVLFSLMAMLAGRAAREMGTEMEAKYGQGSEFQKNLEKATEEMKRAAEEAQRRQQQNK
jgi:hypothetical protein